MRAGPIKTVRVGAREFDFTGEVGLSAPMIF